MNEKKQNIIDIIDSLSAPEKMSKTEALKFLEEIRDDLEMKIESLKMEIQDEEP